MPAGAPQNLALDSAVLHAQSSLESLLSGSAGLLGELLLVLPNVSKTQHLFTDGSVVYRNKGCGFHETSLGDCIVVSSLFRKVLLLTREDVRKSGERN